MIQNSTVRAVVIASVAYWLLRDHPVSYDVGKHIGTYARPIADQYSQIAPGYIAWSIPRYGALSLLAPLNLYWTLTVFLALGWFAYMLYFVTLSGWAEKTLGSFWFGALLALLVSTWGGRQSLLFANHPYEMAFHLLVAALVLSLRRRPWLCACAMTAAGLIHPNVVLMVAAVGAFNLLRNRALLPSFTSAIVAAGFYYLWGTR